MSSQTFPAAGDVIAVLLVTDAQQSVLAGLRSQGRGSAAYTAYGFHSEQNAPGSGLCYAGQRPMPDTGHYLLGNGYRAFNTVLMRFNAPDSLSPFGRGGLMPMPTARVTQSIVLIPAGMLFHCCGG